MILAAMLAVALLAASPALAQDEPAVVADAKAKEAKAGGAKAEAECKDGVIEAKAGGVVAKAPCAPPPPPPRRPLRLRHPRPVRLRRLRPLRLRHPRPLQLRPRLRRRNCRRRVVAVRPRCSRWARALCWLAVASWPTGSSGSGSEHLGRGRGGATRPHPLLRWGSRPSNSSLQTGAIYCTSESGTGCTIPSSPAYIRPQAPIV